MRTSLLLGILSSILSCAASAQTVDWPMYHLNPQHIGWNTAETTIGVGNVIFLAEKWEGLLKGNVDFSSPAIVGDSVYLGAQDGNLYVFDAAGCGQETCQPVWTGQAGGEIFSSPAVANVVVYVGSNSHNLAAFRATGCGQSTCV